MAKYNQWMKFSIGDYLADTAHLTAQQHGIYMLLIMHYWRNESLPDNDAQLFVIAKAFTKEIQDDVKYIVSTFFKNGTQKRLDKEISTAKEKYEKRVIAQKQSVEKRLENSKANCNANSNALACASSCSCSSLSSNSLSKKELSKLFEEFYKAYPKKRNKGTAEKAWKKLPLDNGLFDKIMKAVEASKHSPDWQKDNGTFIPYPASWLNAKGWEDEITPIENDGLSPAGRRTKAAAERVFGGAQ